MASFSLLHPLSPSISTATKTPRLLSPRSPPRLSPPPKTPSLSLIARARARAKSNEAKELKKVEAIEEEEEEDLPWIQEKALDLVEFTGTVTKAIPGPRVGQSPLPWILAVPLAYVGLSFFIAVVKTVKKFTSPKAKKKRLVNKNAFLLKSIDELFLKGKDEVSNSALKELMHKTGFSMDDILRKYIRYALNEKPFNPDMVVDLIRLRKASMLEDPQVAEVLNETSRRIVKEKGLPQTLFCLEAWPSCYGYIRIYRKGFQAKACCTVFVWEDFLFIRGLLECGLLIPVWERYLMCWFYMTIWVLSPPLVLISTVLIDRLFCCHRNLKLPPSFKRHFQMMGHYHRQLSILMTMLSSRPSSKARTFLPWVLNLGEFRTK